MDSSDDKVRVPEKDPSERSRPIRLGGSMLGTPCHVCAFFNSHDDEYRVLLPFIKDGLERGEKAVHTPSIPSDVTSTEARGKRYMASPRRASQPSHMYL